MSRLLFSQPATVIYGDATILGQTWACRIGTLVL